LTDFLTSSLTGGEYDYSFAPAFTSVLFSLERWPEVGQCLRYLFQSSDANSLFDQAMQECISRVLVIPELSFRRLFEIVEELGQTDRFAYCNKFLSTIADLCPGMGAANNLQYIQFGELLFEKLFQFMPNNIRTDFAARYAKVLKERASQLTKDQVGFLMWAKKIWGHFPSTNRRLFLEGLGYMARPDAFYDVREMANQALRDILGLLMSDTKRQEQLARLTSELLEPYPDRANGLRAAAMIMAQTGMRSKEIEEEISRLQTTSDPESLKLAEELRWMLEQKQFFVV
jgi:hypothetical protein